MSAVIDFVLHFDQHLAELVQAYGPWVYGLLFGIIFAETGLVVTPFLPGDSLLFAVGALSAQDGGLNPFLCYALLVTAAFTGNAVNYAIGRAIGPRVFSASDSTRASSHKLLNRQHLQRAHAFFEDLRRQGADPRPVRADRPHVRAVRGRRGADVAARRSSSTTSSARSRG